MRLKPAFSSRDARKAYQTEGGGLMNGCECTIYNLMLQVVSNDYVAWAFMTLAKAYKYAGLLV